MTATLVFNTLNMIQAGLTWLVSRGLHRDRIQAMLDAAENGDLTTEQVQAELDAAEDELAETQDQIDELPDSD